ncbi:MAG: hypothetical protein J6Y94_01770 [Bacteriovoracaceae bacterium]|nr:hypothetical protein [Bacteriovoracaceae bacterium]
MQVGQIIAWGKKFLRPSMATRRYLFFMGAYYVLMWPIYLVLVSVMDFFHLQLGHHLGTMEAWILAWAWPLVLVAKVLALFIVWKLISINEDRSTSWKKIWPHNAWPAPEVWAVLVMFWFLLAILCRPVWSGTSWHLFLEGFFSLAIFYLLDALLIKKITSYLAQREITFTHPGRREFWLAWAIGLEGYVFFCLAFPFAEGHAFYVLINTAIMAYLALWRSGRGADLGAVAIGLFACGGCGFGQDPLWGSAHQIFRLGHELQAAEYFILAVIILGYWGHRQERRKQGQRTNF